MAGLIAEKSRQWFQFVKARQKWLPGVLLAALVWAAFLPALENNFVSYDDPDYVTANPRVQSGLTWENIGWAFTTLHIANWHPLTWLSHMLDCEIFGLEPWGHHLTNLLLHTANTLLLFWILAGMTGAVGRSFFVAALFGVHPLHVESVAWVSERKDVLSALFWMLTLWAYWRFAEALKSPPGKSKFFYWLALIFFALGLMAKPMIVTLPFILLLLDWWPLQRFNSSTLKPLVIEKIPFLLLTAASCVITLIAQKDAGALVPVGQMPWDGRLDNAAMAYARYLGKLFWPSHLAAFYPRPDHWPLMDTITAFVLIAVISFLIFAWRGRRYLTVGWLWFLGTLVPVIGLVQVGGQSMADRYSYLPAIGIFIMVAWTAWDWLKSRRAEFIAVIAATAIILVCLPLTRRQVGYWANDETLFQHMLAVTTDNYLAHYQFGLALEYDGRLDKAIQQFAIATRMNPNDLRVPMDLGLALEKAGLSNEAFAVYQTALKINPAFAPAHANFGMALSQRGETNAAIHELQTALRLAPRMETAHYNLGNLFVRAGRLDEGIAQYQAALKINPDDTDARNNLGIVFYRRGRLDEAAAQFQKAIAAKPGDAEAHDNLGIVFYRAGRLDDAIAEYQQAVRLDPQFAAAQKNLAQALNRKKQLPSRP